MRTKVAAILVCVWCGACSTTAQMNRQGDTVEDVATSAPTTKDRETPEAYLASRDRSSELIVTLESDRLTVRGEQVVVLDEGRVRVEDKKGGEVSMLITPLHEALDETCLEGVQGGPATVSLFADADVSYRLLVEAMYTIGQVYWRCDEDDSKELVAEEGVWAADTSTRFRLMVSRSDGWDGFDITTPRVPIGPDEELALDVLETVVLSLGEDGGVRVMASESTLPPVEGCPDDGATVCARAGRLDVRRLYNTMLGVRAQTARAPQLVFTASADAPMSRVAAVLNAARSRRAGGAEDGTFDDDAAFEAATFSREATPASDAIFPEIIFAVVQ